MPTPPTQRVPAIRLIALCAATSVGACVTPAAVEAGQLHLGLFRHSSTRPTDFAHATELRGVGLSIGDQGFSLGWLSSERLEIDLDRAEGKLETDLTTAYFGQAAIEAASGPGAQALLTPSHTAPLPAPNQAP